MKSKQKLVLWTVDADDVVDDFSDSPLFHRTPWINDFLNVQNSSRYLVVAAKGYGKTFLLKAKRMSFEAERSSIRLIPDNALLDKPGGGVQVFSQKVVDTILHYPDDLVIQRQRTPILL